MSLLPPDATFEERVQDCFLAYRGAGLALSALDIELLERWRTAEVPFEVVARGIRRAAEAALFDARPGQRLRSLLACRRAVDTEIKKHLRTSIGRSTEGTAPPPEPMHLRRFERLRASVRRLRSERPALAGPTERILEVWLAHPPADLAETARLEDGVFVLLLRGLPRSERQGVWREARELDPSTSLPSARGRRLRRRFHRAAVLKRRLELPAFW